MPDLRLPSLSELLQILTTVAAFVAIRLNQLDRRARARPILAVQTVNYSAENGVALTNDEFLINAGGGPALNIIFEVIPRIRVGLPPRTVELDAGYYGAPVVAQEGLNSLWVAQVLEERLYATKDLPNLGKGVQSLDAFMEIRLLFHDQGGIRYAEWISLDVKALVGENTSGNVRISVKRLRSVSTDLHWHYRYNWLTPFWSEQWRLRQRLLKNEREYLQKRQQALAAPGQ